jgi:hypothetical protein
MSMNIHSDMRLEIGRQRQAELLHEAERDRMARVLSADAVDRSGRVANLSQRIGHLRRTIQMRAREAR